MATIEPGEARPFEFADVDELLGLMRELAVFENYAKDFKVTAQDLIEHGLSSSPKFNAFVVADMKTKRLLGMAVTYVVDWTYTMQPNLVLKELYVDSGARGLGVGRMLFDRVLEEAENMGAFKLLWTVLADNLAARNFYFQRGAGKDEIWENWSYTFVKS